MGSGDDDDPPSADWGAAGDTFVELEPGDLQELEAVASEPAARPPDAITPPRGVETLLGYEVGRRDAAREFFDRWDYVLAGEWRRGAAAVLQAVREQLEADGAEPGIAEAILASLAKRAGVDLG